MPICELCGREVERTSKHHIIPKSEGGTETVELCAPCHRTLHAFFENKTLAEWYSNLDRIRDDPEIQKYLKWVRKQPDRKITVARSHTRR
jgi:hypothetical protein